MNVALWIAAIVLALLFCASGIVKLARPRERLVAGGFAWAEDFSRSQISVIGVAEIVGAIGLVLPPALGPAGVLSPVAAACLALLMASAVIVHLRRGEYRELASPAILAVLTAALAVLRFGPFPF